MEQLNFKLGNSLKDLSIDCEFSSHFFSWMNEDAFDAKIGYFYQGPNRTLLDIVNGVVST
jgi:hypothetical protein